MSYITKNCLAEIETKGEILNIIGDYVVLNNKGTGDCPFCNAKKKFSVAKQKGVAGIWKCWSCDTSGGGYVGFVVKIKGITWLEANKLLADKLNITLEYDDNEAPFEQPTKKVHISPKEKAPTVRSFRDVQLSESGLNEADQKYQRKLNDNVDGFAEMDRYQKGSVNPDWTVDPSGDDMVMHYMNLEGEPMKYHRKNNSKDYPLIRVRYANPGTHLDANGRSMKYQSPYGSGTHVWINQKLRSLYQAGAKIKTLYIQEGEKKADKATKHNIISVGIMGIHNIAANKQLPREFELIIKKCEVENVVFIVDGDYLDISDNITNPVDQRPKSFLRAILNFHDYFYALNNSGISLNIYFGYIRPDQKEKGIDDLLTNVLKGSENSLADDLTKTMLEVKGEGKYINVHKITNINEFKLRSEFFKMGTNQQFAEFHKAKLKERKIFKIGRENFKFSNKEEFPELEPDTLVLAQPLSANEEFWEKKTSFRNNIPTTTTVFKYVKCCVFLSNRHFYKYRIDKNGEFNFINVEGNVVRLVVPSIIREYLMDFTRFALQDEEVLEMLYKGSKMYLSDNLNNLDYKRLNFHKADKGVQYMYFTDTFWKINAEGIVEKPIADLNGHVWADNIKPFKAKYLPPMVKILKNEEGKYKITFPSGTKAATDCDFLNYIWNTSNFYWKETHEGQYKINPPATPKVQLNDFQLNDITMHFISKCCAIGFMTHTYFDPNNAKAVVAMDGKITEVGSSNGRSGKSLMADALYNLLPTVIIPGKQKDLMEDKFLFEGVTEATSCVVFDDVRTNFDFEGLFSLINGYWKINPKGAKSFSLQREDSPKIFITTNHALNGEGGSFRDRQFLIAFSDYYSENYRPLDEHKVRFFDEWSVDQWNMFYNFVACCQQIYFEHGLVQAPMERLEKRRLRQQIGEAIIDWAETFYDGEVLSGMDGSNNINKALPRADVTSSFYTMFPDQRKYIDNRKFKTLLQKYCVFKGLEFNPGREDTKGMDKRNGVEYFTIADEKYDRSKPAF